MPLLLFSPEPSHEDILAFMDDTERLHWENQQLTNEQRTQFWKDLENLWRSIPDPTLDELDRLMRDEERLAAQADNRSREQIFNFYRRKWKRDRKADAIAQRERQESPIEPEPEPPNPKELSVSTGDTLQQPQNISLEVGDDISSSLHDAQVATQSREDQALGTSWNDKFWRLAESNFFMGGGVGMALAAYAFLLAGAHRFAFLLLVLAWLIIAISVYKHGFFEGKRPLRQMIDSALVCAIVGLVLALTWYLLVQGQSAATQMPPPTTKEGSRPSLTEPKTEERIFTDVDASYLVGLYKQYSTAQADQAVRTYIGKWIKVTGTVSDVTREDHLREPSTVSVSMYVETSSKDGDGYTVGATFEDQTSMDRALVLSRKQRITVSGKIRRVIEPGILLDNCRFVETPK